MLSTKRNIFSPINCVKNDEEREGVVFFLDLPYAEQDLSITRCGLTRCARGEKCAEPALAHPGQARAHMTPSPAASRRAGASSALMRAQPTPGLAVHGRSAAAVSSGIEAVKVACNRCPAGIQHSDVIPR